MGNLINRFDERPDQIKHPNKNPAAHKGAAGPEYQGVSILLLRLIKCSGLIPECLVVPYPFNLFFLFTHNAPLRRGLRLSLAEAEICRIQHQQNCHNNTSQRNGMLGWVDKGKRIAAATNQ